jgi:glycosyltransferase involved in cell wall biosynthesis
MDCRNGAQLEADRARSLGSVSIVHDYLNQLGGAERILLHIAGIWEGAPLYTSLYRPDSVFSEFRDLTIRTTFVDRFPVDEGFRALAPILPLAFRSLGVLDDDVVVSSSSGWAHGVRTAPHTTHVVYCYSPARWLYSGDEYFDNRSRKMAIAALTAMLRRWDHRAAQRADAYIAIAENVRTRIKAAYGLDADVVYPPVEVDRFTPRPPGDRLLVIARLLPYKRVDLVIAAAKRLGIGLDVVGAGPLSEQLRALGGPSVTFHGSVSDAELVELVEGCKAVCMPGREDFGLVALEGNAAGKPAIVFGAGGALETIEDGVNGLVFSQPTVEAVVDAIRRLESFDTSPEVLATCAERYSPARFKRSLVAAVRSAVERNPRRRIDFPHLELRAPSPVL